MQQENIALQAQANQEASMTAESAKTQARMQEMEAEAQLKQLEAELEMARMDKEFQLKAQLIQMQQGINIQAQASKDKAQLDKEAYKEDRKDKRTAKQASQQSKLIQQRKQDLDPIDFDGQDSLGSGLQGLTSM